jgi:hypothetical protein
MSKFLKRSSIFVLSFWLPICAVYLVEDPFRVLYQYSDYSNAIVYVNRDFVSTQTFIDKYPRYNYNSFIFGSSRSMGFNPETWVEFLDSQSYPFCFDAAFENIKSIRDKILFLDKQGVNIKNALILICRDHSFTDLSIENSNYVNRKHPVFGEQSRLRYQFDVFKSFVNSKFIFNYIDFKMYGIYRERMEGYIEPRLMIFDSVSNFMKIAPRSKSNVISIDFNSREFYNRPFERIDSIKRINIDALMYLTEINTLLQKHNSNFKVILTPLYEQIKFHPSDKIELVKIFGNRLYDFTGKNELTNMPSNYYESSHFKPLVGDSIMQFIFSSSR